MAKPLKTKEELKQQTLSELEKEQKELEEKKKKEEERKRKEKEERKRREAVAKNLAANADKNPLEKGAEQNLQKVAQQQKEAEARRKQEAVAKNIAANAGKNPLERAAEQNVLRTEERLKEDRERQKLSEVAKNLVSEADRNPLEKAAEENIANLPVPEKEKPEIRPHQQNIPREDPAFRYMTAEEKQKYEFYKAITGEESAQKYLDFLTLQEQNKAISEEESAQKYLDSIREEINRRQAEKIYSGNENEILSQYLLGAQAGLESSKTGFQDAIRMFLEEGQTRPTSTSEYLSEMARNDLAEKGPKLPKALGGSSLGQIGFDVVNTTANMLPSIMLGTLGGATVGAAGIGASAAGNAYNSALREGYTQEQARNYGLLVGAAEASLGYLLGGIEATGGKIGKGAMAKLLPKIDNALAKAAVNVGGKMGSEFSEEYLQEILDPMFRNLALLEENEIDFLSPEAIYSGILGALSAGGIAVAGGNASAPEVLQKAEVPVPFEGTAQPGTERELVANKITEIENRPISEAEKAAKMEEVAKAAAENGTEPGLVEEAEKFKNIHEQKAAEETKKELSQNAETFGEWILLQDKETIDTHTPEQLHTMFEYDISVDPEILDYIKYAKEHPERHWEKVELPEVSNRAVNDIKKETGIDTTGFTHWIDVDFVNHTEKRHGESGEQDHSMADDSDLARVKFVIDNYDDLKVSDHNGTRAYRNTDGSRAKTIVYQKAINGTYYIVEAVPDSKAKKLHLLSAYISTKKEIPTVQMADAKTSAGTPEARLQSEGTSNFIISPVDGKSNPLSIGNNVFGAGNFWDINPKNNEQNAVTETLDKMASESVSAEISDSAKRVIEQMRPRKPKVQSSTSQVNPEPESTKLVDVPQSKKSERIERRYQKAVEDGVASVFGIDRSDIKNDIRPVLDEIAKDVKDGKKISDEQIDRLYKTAFENGYIKEEFPQYDEIRKYIRSAPVFVDEKTRHEFGDDFEFRDFARKNFGSIKFTTDPKARHLDEFFENLSSMEPDFFDGFETDPKTQLESISDFMNQTKKQYYGLSEVYSGTELSDFENWAKKELKAYMDEFSKGLDNVRRYEQDRQIKATNKAREMDKTASFEQAKAAFENNKVFDAKKELEKVKAKNLLNDEQNLEVKRLLEGTLTEGDVVALGGNVEGILEVYNAEKAYKEARAPFDRYKAAYKTAMQHDAIEATELSDEWNDKKIGFLYSRETAERNIKDIAGKGGRKVLEEYFEPIHENEAMKTRWITEMNRRVAGLELGKMNQWERAYAQMIGENAAYIANGRITKHDQHEHEVLNERISALLSEHGNKIDKAKCEKAAAGFMEIYEDILEEWNDERIRRGQEPLGKIENYFPHFTETKPENTIQKIFSFFGFDINSSKLPTDIAGRTADRKPNTKYNPHAQRRTTDVTDYDILKGFDGYVRAVGDNIFHTEDIQKIRALSDTIRTKYSSAEIEKRIEDIRNRQDLSEEDKEALISEAFKSDPGAYHLSNLVVWLDEYANILAGKKSRGDRETEYQMGREIYDISKAIEGRIASNMIGYNLSTPVMNLVPMFQATADVSPVDIVSSFIQTGVAAARGDSFISDNSDFLTNRFGTDSVYKKNYNLFTSENMKDAVAKIQDGGAFLMEFVDRIAAESLVRARYQQNLKKGMDKVSAFSEADQWAAGLMADRSLGALPTVFNIKNPVAKALTMFQIEVNNQYSYIFKDAGKYKARDEGKASMITGQIAFWAAMAICNGLADELLGRDNVVPDPIGMSYDAIKKVAEGEPVGDVALDTATNVIEQLPFIGGLLGGGRVPLSTAFPDFEQGIKLFNPEVSGEKKKQILLDEITKPFSYLLLPSGAGQIWKTGKGVQQIAEGGAFGTENDGSRFMKFPQEYDPESLLKTIIFGQYASDRGQQYIDSGFKDKLSAKQTEQMEQAENWGISNSEFYDIILGLKPFAKKEEKQEALFENEELSSGEKGILEQIIFGNAETRDYGSKEDFYRSGLTDSEKRLFDEGFYGGELDRLEKAIESGEKKEDKILSIVKELGCSEAEAFEILQKRNGDWNSEIPEKESARVQGAADYYGMSEKDYLSVYNYKNFGENKEDVVENLMAANGWDRETAEENYNKVFLYEYSKEDLPEKAAADLDVSGNWYEVEEEAFFIARNIIKTAEGEEDEFGNTVSGSKKAEAISKIAKALGIDEDEAAIYYLAANGDLAFSTNDLSSSKQADLKAAISYGWTERQFLDAVNIIKLSGATKKDDIINALMDAGAPYDMAVGYYNLSKNYDYWKR